jgi:hypothetical protein
VIFFRQYISLGPQEQLLGVRIARRAPLPFSLASNIRSPVPVGTASASTYVHTRAVCHSLSFVLPICILYKNENGTG